MPYKGWESLPVEEDCIRRWASDLKPSMARNYVYYLLRYLKWAKEKGYWASAQAMIGEYEAFGPKEQFRHVEALKEYIKQLKTGMRDRRYVWFVVRNFYDYHRLKLPELSRSEASRLFAPSEKDKRRSVELSPLRLEDVRQLVLNAAQPYKAAFMVLFQSAMGLAEFEEFNRLAWRKVVEDLGSPGPLRIDLWREKTSRGQVKRYYTFIGEDAKRLIGDWLSIRPKVDLDALFVTFNKNDARWVPVTGRLIADMITKVAKRAGLIRPSSLGRYRIHAHEFRDLFKSLCTLRGVSPVASEYFLGHSIDRLGYDKSPEYDEEWFRHEYLKVEPQLNLISNPPGRGEDQELTTLRVLVESRQLDLSKPSIRQYLAQKLGMEDMAARVARMKERGLSEEEAEVNAICGGLGLEPMKLEAFKAKEANSDPKKVICEHELERYLADGWDVQTVLPSGKILVRK
ncbi:MAG: hypothetical protein QW057_04125 [Candidatus Bathyarchaeia archaeon]